eukprot:TRINITY_DN1132_c0_g1_i2.p1 TRINITY_DN1132_c0_g1~~TRINITY_DN1132_c0_g1_i2.p1  ORF type:complete len:256 (-),score=64.70 TRINITY_DN1132_c0_g1_i2:424-1191(-)
MLRSLVGSEMCIRDRYQRRVRGTQPLAMPYQPLSNSNQDRFHQTTKCPGCLVANKETGCCGCCGVQTGTTIIVVLSVISCFVNIVLIAMGKGNMFVGLGEESEPVATTGTNCHDDGPSGVQYFSLFMNVGITAALVFGAVRRHAMTLIVCGWALSIISALFFVAVVAFGVSFVQSDYEQCITNAVLSQHPEKEDMLRSVQYISAVLGGGIGLCIQLWLSQVVLSHAHYIQCGDTVYGEVVLSTYKTDKSILDGMA